MYDGMVWGTGGILLNTGLKGSILGLGISFSSWHSWQCATRSVAVIFSSSQSRKQSQRGDEFRNEVNAFVWTEYRVSNMALEVRQQTALLFEPFNAIFPRTSIGSLWIFRIISILIVYNDERLLYRFISGMLS